MGCCCSVSSCVTSIQVHCLPRHLLTESKKRVSKKEGGGLFKKVLLLGAAEAGKTTVLKQLRMLHSGGFSVKEMENFKTAVRVSALEYLLEWLREEVEVSKWDAELQQSYGELAAMLRNKSNRWSRPGDDCLRLARRIWSDEGISALFAQADEGPSSSSAKSYFLSHFDRLSSEDFQPTKQDVLALWVPTTGISEARLSVAGLPVHLVDVGGQRCERKKWLHCFESVDAVVFVAALSEYDQTLAEDPAVNRIQESVKLFGSVCSVKWFRRAAILLFLNKKDLFVEKVCARSLRHSFPDFSGADGDCGAAMGHVASLFRAEAAVAAETPPPPPPPPQSLVASQQARRKSGGGGGGGGVMGSPSPGRSFYVHFTCATETESVRSCFGTVADMLRAENVRTSGRLC